MQKISPQLLKKSSQTLLFFVCAAQLSFADGSDADAVPFTGTDTVIDAGTMRFSAADGMQHLSGGVNVTAGAIRLHTEAMIYDTRTQTAEIPTPAELDFRNSRFVLRTAFYDGAEQRLVARTVRGGRQFAFFEGAKVSAARELAEVSDASFYLGEPHWSSISFSTSRLAYDAEEDYFHLGSSVLRVAGVPVLPLPPLSVMRFDRPPVRVWLDLGGNGSAGEFLRSEVYVTLWDAVEPGIMFDFYERSGVLAGPAAAYDTRDSAFPLKMRGHLRSGYINDTGTREDDIFGNDIGGRRGFIDWFHKQELADFELSASVHRWSDSEAERDFRPDIYDENQNPDTYFEAVLPNDYFYASAFARFHPNDYQNVQQRLPELRFDLQPTELGKTGIYQHFNASYALLREETSDQFNFVRNRFRVNDGDAMESSRANASASGMFMRKNSPIDFPPSLTASARGFRRMPPQAGQGAVCWKASRRARSVRLDVVFAVFSKSASTPSNGRETGLRRPVFSRNSRAPLPRRMSARVSSPRLSQGAVSGNGTCSESWRSQALRCAIIFFEPKRQGLIAPSFSDFFGSGTTSSGRKRGSVPSPPQTGQAPSGWRSEKLRGASGS